jgi:hypothetical protein
VRRSALFAAALAIPLTAAAALAETIAASPPSAVSATVYRAPGRNGGAISLDGLGGFAVITETRTVSLPAGPAELRFAGVVDGIIPESAIVSGLPGGIIEKNRDAELLSPSSLARAAIGKTLALKRTDRATGKARLIPATLVSASADGAVFKTAAGNEAFQCSGQPETFAFRSAAGGLGATPVLSVKTRSPHAITATVTLTYIAEAFDWNASYTATLAADGRTLNLGGWITLANGNAVGLPDARTQIVAGGLNREYLRRYLGDQPHVIAQCWPAQTTSDIPEAPQRLYQLVRPFGRGGDARDAVMVTAMRKGNYQLAGAPVPIMAPAPPQAEQLGDLKLYRVPQRTTLAAHQLKQTRLIEQTGVAVERTYTLTVPARPDPGGEQTFTARAILRTQNDTAHGLGLPLPAGTVVVQQDQQGRPMLIGQPDLRDTAVGEALELPLGEAPDIRAVQRAGSGGAELELSNAADHPIVLEVKLQLQGTAKVTHADQPIILRSSQPTFRITLPANAATQLHYTVDPN